MHRWRLSITTGPACRFDMARRMFARQGPILASLVAMLMTLALGRAGPASPQFAWFSFEAAGLVGIAGFGLIAWHLARLTALPLAESRPAALAASLIPVLTLPGLGLAALVAPLILSLWAAWNRPAQRVVALMVQCGALVLLTAGTGDDRVISFVYAMALGIALFLALRALPGAANDNPSMERIVPTSRLMKIALYARAESIPGKWGVSNV